MQRFLVYILSNTRDNTIAYVGKTTNSLKRRLSQHKSKAKLNPETYVEKWIKGLLTQSFEIIIELLEEVNSEEELNDAECFWIANFRATGAKLINCTDGGEGATGWHHKSESIEAISRNKMGKSRPAFSEEWKKNLGAARKGKPLSPQTLQKLSEINKGQKRPEFTLEHREKLSKANKGKHQGLSRPIIDDLGNKYKSPITAAKILQITPGNIYKVLRGERLRSGGRSFKWLDETPIKPPSKSIKIKPFQDQFGNTYQYVTEAANKLGINSGGIWKVLKGRIKQTKGYVFKYLDEKSSP